MASRWILWLTQKGTPTSGEKESFCTKENVSYNCLVGCVQVLVSKLQAHLSQLWFGHWGWHSANYIFPLSAGFLLGSSTQDTGENQKGREKGLASSCSLVDLSVPLVNSPSFWHQPRVPASNFWGMPSSGLTATPLQRSLFISGHLSSGPLGLLNCSLVPLFPRP